MDKRMTTIELTQDDKRYIEALSIATGIVTNIGVLRYALRYAVTHEPVAGKAWLALSSSGVSAMEAVQGASEPDAPPFDKNRETPQ